MQTKPMPTTPAELAAGIRNRIAEVEAWAQALDHDARRAWVVVAAHELPLAFTIEGESITNPRTVSIEDATRFPRARATRIALQCWNGEGVTALAFPLPLAAEHAIDDMRKTLGMIEAHQ